MSSTSSSPAPAGDSASAYVPLNVFDFATALNARRRPAALHSMMPLVKIPGMLSLAGGLPNPKLFPFKQLSFTLADGTSLSLNNTELSDALQYSATPGLPSMLQLMSELQTRVHAPPLPYGGPRGWSVSMGTGSSDVLAQAFDLLVEAGDNVIVESPTYAGALSALLPLQANLHEVEVDEQGMIPDKLRETLAKFDGVTGRAKPRLLYVIPTGQNPAGCTLTEARKREIYALACAHNLIILEDDPYYFLAYGRAAAPSVADEGSWQRPLTKSFFSMDTEGRVIRLDSFSKILSSGLRLGMVSGPTAFVERMDLVLQVGALHSSGVSQMLAYRLLQHWGTAGWEAHIKQVCLFYARRRDVFVSLLEKHLKGLVEYSVPEAGMFIYMRVLGVVDTKKLVEENGRAALVLLVPGQAFSPNNKPGAFVRASFSIASDADMDTALERFAKLLREAVASNSSPAAAQAAATAAASNASSQ